MSHLTPLRFGVIRTFGILMNCGRLQHRICTNVGHIASAPNIISYSTPNTYDGRKYSIQRYSTQPKHKIMCNKPETKMSAKIVTLPNILTCTRIAMSPAIGYFIWNGMYDPALACFAYAALTDLLDGYLARKLKQETQFGAILDPIADKLLITTCLISLFNVDTIPVALVKGIVARDFFIVAGAGCIRYFGLGEKASLRRFFDFKNYPTIGLEPTLFSKFNTLVQCLVVVVHLSKTHLAEIVPNFELSLTLLHWFTAATTSISFAQYLKRFGEHQFFTTERKFRG